MNREQDKTSAGRDDYLLGQGHALMAMVQALLISHPDPKTVRKIFENQLMKTEGVMISTPLSDEYFNGIRDVQKELYVRGTNPAEEK